MFYKFLLSYITSIQIPLFAQKFQINNELCLVRIFKVRKERQKHKEAISYPIRFLFCLNNKFCSTFILYRLPTFDYYSTRQLHREAVPSSSRYIHTVVTADNTGYLKKSFTTSQAYINLFWRHVQCFELSQYSKAHCNEVIRGCVVLLEVIASLLVTFV
jgi:hypothetical protein